MIHRVTPRPGLGNSHVPRSALSGAEGVVRSAFAMDERTRDVVPSVVGDSSEPGASPLALFVVHSPDAAHRDAMIPLDRPLTIGRREATVTVNLALEDGRVSRRHAVIKLRDGECYLEDLSSANGTFVNKEQLAANTPRLLQHGDELRLGNILIRIELTS